MQKIIKLIYTYIFNIKIFKFYYIKSIFLLVFVTNKLIINPLILIINLVILNIFKD